MKISTIAGAAALLPLLALPALAQDASSAVSAASSMVSNDVELGLSTEASAAGGAEASTDASLDTLLTALMADQAGTDLSTITDASQINFVTVSSLQIEGSSDLDSVVTEHQDAIDQLRTDIGANATLSAKLSEASYTADQVLAIAIETDGSVTVYVDDRA